jgi:hypothetical protein
MSQYLSSVDNIACRLRYFVHFITRIGGDTVSHNRSNTRFPYHSLPCHAKHLDEMYRSMGIRRKFTPRLVTPPRSQLPDCHRIRAKR